MIKPISVSSLSFEANSKSARENYAECIKRNSQIAQRQNDIVAGIALAQTQYQIPMQGQAQKLDVIA